VNNFLLRFSLPSPRFCLLLRLSLIPRVLLFSCFPLVLPSLLLSSLNRPPMARKKVRTVTEKKLQARHLPKTIVFTDLTYPKRFDAFAKKIEAQGTEVARANLKQEMAEEAYLGMGRFKLPTQATQGYELSIDNKYNHGREINQQVFEQMVADMTSGRCYVERNPVIIAIDPETIDTQALAKNAEDEISDIVFAGGRMTTIYVLNGVHRLSAAADVFKRLRKVWRQQEIEIQEQEDNIKDPNCPDRDQVEDDIARLRRAVSAMKDVIELVQDWPAHIYSKSESRLSFSLFGSTEATDSRT
jgi:hypothetical protein